MTVPAPFDDALARIAFDLSPSGMLAVDDSGRIVAANREIERLFGWTRSELIGRSIETLVPERLRGGHPGHRARFEADPQARPMGAGRELNAMRQDGTEFPVEIGLNPVRLGDRTVVLATVVDISARRTLEENLRRSQKLEAIGVLAGGIAHDFNNILLGIVGHAELVLREAKLGDQSREDLDQVLKAAERGRELVKRILLFSRNAEVARVPLRLERVIGEAVKLLRASLPSTIEIRTALDAAAPVVSSDETQMHQILMNLGTNSSHAMPAGGTLTVRLEPFLVGPEFAASHPGVKPGPHARITVSDTGFGMSADVLAHALEPFYTTKAPGEGTGLGLSVIHGIVRGHEGHLEITSAPGQGTTVAILLPAAGVAPAPSAEGVAGPATARGPRILFVEDEPILAHMQRRQLEHLGFEVTVHTSSLEALEDFRSRPRAFALMITDDTMPRMTGRVLAREVLGIRPDLPILMVSGGEAADAVALEAIGVRRLLRKPHSAVELERAIGEVLQTRPGV